MGNAPFQPVVKAGGANENRLPVGQDKVRAPEPRVMPGAQTLIVTAFLKAEIIWLLSPETGRYRRARISSFEPGRKARPRPPRRRVRNPERWHARFGFKNPSRA